MLMCIICVTHVYVELTCTTKADAFLVGEFVMESKGWAVEYFRMSEIPEPHMFVGYFNKYKLEEKLSVECGDQEYGLLSDVGHVTMSNVEEIERMNEMDHLFPVEKCVVRKIKTYSGIWSNECFVSRWMHTSHQGTHAYKPHFEQILAVWMLKYMHDLGDNVLIAYATKKPCDYGDRVDRSMRNCLTLLKNAVKGNNKLKKDISKSFVYITIIDGVFHVLNWESGTFQRVYGHVSISSLFASLMMPFTDESSGICQAIQHKATRRGVNDNATYTRLDKRRFQCQKTNNVSIAEITSNRTMSSPVIVYDQGTVYHNSWGKYPTVEQYSSKRLEKMLHKSWREIHEFEEENRQRNSYSASLDLKIPKLDIDKPLPNVGYLFVGYMSEEANPVNTFGIDPGFRNAPIFRSTYLNVKATSDLAYTVPDGTWALTSSSCEKELTSKTFSSSDSYNNEMTAHVDVHAGFLNIVSFQANAEYSKKINNIQNNNMVLVHSVASCQTYVVSLDIYDPPSLKCLS